MYVSSLNDSSGTESICIVNVRDVGYQSRIPYISALSAHDEHAREDTFATIFLFNMGHNQLAMKQQSSGTDMSFPESNTEKAMDHNEVAVFSIDPHHEKTAIRKFDIILMPQIAAFVLVCYLDRSNIGNARVFGLEGLSMVPQFPTNLPDVC